MPEIYNTRGDESSYVIDSTVGRSFGEEQQVREVAFGAGTVQSRTARAQERFPRCRTSSEAVSGSGTDSELCARCRTTSVANRNTPEIPADTRSGATEQPIGVSPGRGPH